LFNVGNLFSGKRIPGVARYGAAGFLVHNRSLYDSGRTS